MSFLGVYEKRKIIDRWSPGQKNLGTSDRRDEVIIEIIKFLKFHPSQLSLFLLCLCPHLFEIGLRPVSVICSKIFGILEINYRIIRINHGLINSINFFIECCLVIVQISNYFIILNFCNLLSHKIQIIDNLVL